jgi:hypothetical protein
MSQEEFSEYTQSDTEEHQSEHDEKYQSEYDEKHQSEHDEDENQKNITFTPGTYFTIIVFVFNQVSLYLLKLIKYNCNRVAYYA